MSMIPEAGRSLGNYLTRHDLIERIAARECALADGPSLRSRLSCMSTLIVFVCENDRRSP